MKPFRIVATIEIKAEFEKELINIFQTITNSSRQEEGCIEYDLHQDTKNPLKYIILEIWKDQKAIDIHNETPHFKSFVAAIDGKVEKVTVDILNKIY